MGPYAAAVKAAQGAGAAGGRGGGGAGGVKSEAGAAAGVGARRGLGGVGPNKVGRRRLTLSNPNLKAPGTNRLKLKYDKLPSILLQICFQFQLALLQQGARAHPGGVSRHRGAAVEGRG